MYIVLFFILECVVGISRGEAYTYLIKDYDGDLVCRLQWGGGEGLHAESDWGVWRSAPLEVVGADIHSPAPIPTGGLCRQSPRPGMLVRHPAYMSRPGMLVRHPAYVSRPGMLVRHPAYVSRPGMLVRHPAYVSRPGMLVRHPAYVSRPGMLVRHPAWEGSGPYKTPNLSHL